MTFQLFLVSLALNILTIAIPVGFAVYVAQKIANKHSAKETIEALRNLGVLKT